MDMYLESRKEPVANLETARSRGITVYSDDRIAFIDSLQNIGTEGPIRLDAAWQSFGLHQWKTV